MLNFGYNHKITIEPGQQVPKLTGTEVAVHLNDKQYIYEDIDDTELDAFKNWVFDAFECNDGSKRLSQHVRDFHISHSE